MTLQVHLAPGGADQATVTTWCATCHASEVFEISRAAAKSALAEAEAAGLAPRLMPASSPM